MERDEKDRLANKFREVTYHGDDENSIITGKTIYTFMTVVEMMQRFTDKRNRLQL